MKVRKPRIFVGDFETTVYTGQVNTEVWASGSAELFTEEVQIFHSIGEQLEYYFSLKSHVIAYYHNLKFDGSFWLSHLLVDLGYKQAYEQPTSDTNSIRWLREKDMPNKSFKYSISDKGQWYSIIIRNGKNFIEIRDSLKLLPFSVQRIGHSFKTKHKKLEMEYTGFRYSGCTITDEEKEYLKNDLLVIKEALEIMFEEGHTKLTIGSCCLEEFKNTMLLDGDYDRFFPNVYEMELECKDYTNFGDWLRKSYRGGWCYYVKGKEKQIKENGFTIDVNSLYPSSMHSESGNRYPVGKPTYWCGDYIPTEATHDNRYFFVRVKTRFYVKHNMLPFIQIKDNLLYKGTEVLESSDVLDPKTDEYCTHYTDRYGNKCDTRVTMTLTMTDFKLLKDHYHLVDFEILDGCWFFSEIGIFDRYIDKYKNLKIVSTGARRELAKLFLNNLYGKMASSTDNSFKVAYIKEDKSLGFKYVLCKDKLPGYIPIGSAITSYSRNFTIRSAQANYYGKDKPGFIYADTDSIHCDLPISEVKGVKLHNSDFCCWKLESEWDKAIFTRQKTYIEHIVREDGKECTPYYLIKCAGMPQRCKELLNYSLTHTEPKDKEKLSEESIKFLYQDDELIHRDLSDFTIGLSVPGKLIPKRIRGGILLVDTTYQMK